MTVLWGPVELGHDLWLFCSICDSGIFTDLQIFVFLCQGGLRPCRLSTFIKSVEFSTLQNLLTRFPTLHCTIDMIMWKIMADIKTSYVSLQPCSVLLTLRRSHTFGFSILPRCLNHGPSSWVRATQFLISQLKSTVEQSQRSQLASIWHSRKKTPLFVKVSHLSSTWIYWIWSSKGQSKLNNYHFSCKTLHFIAKLCSQIGFLNLLWFTMSMINAIELQSLLINLMPNS